MEDLIRLYEQKREPVKKKLAKRHTATTRDAKETGTIHGTWQFEIELKLANGMEYDYEIKASDGKILNDGNKQFLFRTVMVLRFLQPVKA